MKLESTYGMEGKVPVERLRDAFEVDKHPEVVQGLRTEQSVANEFLETFEANHQLFDPDSDLISLEEFVDYYRNCSSAIESDQTFELIMKNVWGYAANAQPMPAR